MKRKQGKIQWQVPVLSDQTYQITEALRQLRNNYNKPFQFGVLAAELGMSLATFHHHFKAATGMSPLQFKKQLRLQEARRLMLCEQIDPSTAAYLVGYYSSSIFIWEYERAFGQPPMLDIEHLREIDKRCVVDCKHSHWAR